MHAVHVTVDIDTSRVEETDKLLHEVTVPTAKASDGFVRGVWLRSPDQSVGCGILLFDDEEHATAAAERARGFLAQGAPATIKDVKIFAVVAEA